MCSIFRPFSKPGAFLSIFLNDVATTYTEKFRVSIPGAQSAKDTDPSLDSTGLLEGPLATFGLFNPDTSLNRFIVQQLNGERAASKTLSLVDADGALLGSADVPLFYPVLPACDDTRSDFFFTGTLAVSFANTSVGYSLQYGGWHIPTFYCEKACFTRPMAQPSNAVSSLAFVLVAFPMLRAAFRGAPRGFHAANAAANAVAGLGSFWFHATFAPPAQQTDMAGVYAIMLVPLLHTAWAVARKTRPLVHQLCFGIVSLTACAVLGFFGWQLEALIPGKETTIVCVLGCSLATAVAWHAWQTGWDKRRLADGVIACLAIAVAIVGRFGDAVSCHPYSWFQFHALWHVGAAASMFYLWRALTLERPPDAAKTTRDSVDNSFI